MYSDGAWQPVSNEFDVYPSQIIAFKSIHRFDGSLEASTMEYRGQLILHNRASLWPNNDDPGFFLQYDHDWTASPIDGWSLRNATAPIPAARSATIPPEGYTGAFTHSGTSQPNNFTLLPETSLDATTLSSGYFTITWHLRFDRWDDSPVNVGMVNRSDATNSYSSTDMQLTYPNGGMALPTIDGNIAAPAIRAIVRPLPTITSLNAQGVNDRITANVESSGGVITSAAGVQRIYYDRDTASAPPQLLHRINIPKAAIPVSGSAPAWVGAYRNENGVLTTLCGTTPDLMGTTGCNSTIADLGSGIFKITGTDWSVTFRASPGNTLIDPIDPLFLGKVLPSSDSLSQRAANATLGTLFLETELHDAPANFPVISAFSLAEIQPAASSIGFVAFNYQPEAILDAAPLQVQYSPDGVTFNAVNPGQVCRDTASNILTVTLVNGCAGYGTPLGSGTPTVFTPGQPYSFSLRAGDTDLYANEGNETSETFWGLDWLTATTPYVIQVISDGFSASPGDASATATTGTVKPTPIPIKDNGTVTYVRAWAAQPRPTASTTVWLINPPTGWKASSWTCFDGTTTYASGTATAPDAYGDSTITLTTAELQACNQG